MHSIVYWSQYAVAPIIFGNLFKKINNSRTRFQLYIYTCKIHTRSIGIHKHVSKRVNQVIIHKIQLKPKIVII